MFEKVLFATDLSEASDRVMKSICALRPFGTKKVIVLHALGVRHPDALQHEIARLSIRRLEEQRRYLENVGYESSVNIAPGNPAAEIKRFAEEEQVSLIAMGSHGAGLTREILLGSVTLEVLHRATIPVLILRSDASTAEPNGQFSGPEDLREHILYTTDFSRTSKKSFEYVESLVDLGVRRATLIHVQDEIIIRPHLEERMAEFNRLDLERLERLQIRLLEHGVDAVHLILRTGSPTREIIRAMAETPFSLVIMGSQGRGFIEEVFLGSVSHQVARHATIPVLLIPAERA